MVSDWWMEICLSMCLYWVDMINPTLIAQLDTIGIYEPVEICSLITRCRADHDIIRSFSKVSPVVKGLDFNT